MDSAVFGAEDRSNSIQPPEDGEPANPNEANPMNQSISRELNGGRKSLPHLIAICLSALVLVAPRIEARVFTSSDGKQVDAEVIEVRGGSVILGIGTKRYTLEIGRFSKADQEYIAEWKANADKTKIPKLDVQISPGSNNRLDKKDCFDDRVGSFNFTIKVENEEQGYNIENAEATLVVLGESCEWSDEFVVFQRQTFKISVEEGKTFEWKGPELKYRFDDSPPAYWGHKYYAYLFMIKNADGVVIFRKASQPKFDAFLDAGIALKEKEFVDKSLKKLNRTHYLYF